MCTSECINFGNNNLTEADIFNKKVIEVGSRNVNGTLRTIIQKYNPKSYVGVDIIAGADVDEICDVNNLSDRFGCESFDVVISTEMLEHVKDWRKAIFNLKDVLKVNGILLLTTRSIGFPQHNYPFDFWRFETDDMKFIFSDMDILALEKENSEPGVFIKARKPTSFKGLNLDSYELYSILTLNRCL